GLVPAEGAAAIVLKRLSDISPGERVHGVIRSVGLSNDGARRGLLVPDREGQVEAMRNAYALAELDPARDVSLIECHATGTPTGDGTELLATSDVFADAGGLPVGSLKSNMGHLITVAGMGSLLKLISAMEHKTLPPTLIDGEPSSVFEGLPLHPQTEAEPWKTRGSRRAGLSNFGFGGNDAHLILEEYRKPRKASAPAQPAIRVKRPAPVVICGIGMNAGPDRGVAAIMRRLMRGRGNPAGQTEDIIANPLSAKMPPLDMARTQAQQLAVLDVAGEALAGVKLPAATRIGCFVGMGCDPDATRLMLSNRLAELLGPDVDPSEIARMRAQIADPINSADTLGAMPNLPANRLNAAYDWRGMGFTVSAEELSGIAALELACRAVSTGELDMALVAAADFSADRIHEAALAGLGLDITSGDGAVALVIKRSKDAKRDGETVLARVGEINLQAAPGNETVATPSLIDRVYGRAHAASGLMQVAVTALLGARRLVASAKAPAPWLTDEKTPKLDVDAASFTGSFARVHLTFDAALPAPDAVRPVPLMEYYAADSAPDLIARMDRNMLGGEGLYRLALMAYTPEDMAAKRVAMRNLLARDELPSGEGVFYGDAAPDGELAFVFTGAAAAYGRMGVGLLGAFPEVGETLAGRHDVASKIAPLLATALDDPFDQLRSMTLLCQAHVTLLGEILGVEPEVSIGLSAGETNAMIAFRAWRDPGALLAGMEKSGAYERYIGGKFEALIKAQDED
ncbi:MAG: beta-ketoacyl synthase N-terminal-like domain-containing protein, partial [Hyphomonadaceae bacterium]